MMATIVSPPEMVTSLVPKKPLDIRLKKQTEKGIVLPHEPENPTACFEPSCKATAEWLVGMALPKQWFYPGEGIELVPVLYVTCSRHKLILEEFQKAYFPRAPLLLIADISLKSKNEALNMLKLLCSKSSLSNLLFEET